MEFWQDQVERARKKDAVLVFTEGDDERVRSTAERLVAEKVCAVILVGHTALEGCELVDSESYAAYDTSRTLLSGLLAFL